MNVYWLLIIFGAFIALFSKEIDAAAARNNKNGGKRAGIVACVLLAGGGLGLLLSHFL